MVISSLLNFGNPAQALIFYNPQLNRMYIIFDKPIFLFMLTSLQQLSVLVEVKNL